MSLPLCSYKPLAKVRVKVEDTKHSATRHLGETFEIEDDLYLFKSWDRNKVHVLLSMEDKDDVSCKKADESHSFKKLNFSPEVLCSKLLSRCCFFCW